MKKTSYLKFLYQNIPFKRNTFEFIRYFYTPSTKIYRHLFFAGKFKIKVNDTFFYMNHYNNHGFIIEDSLFWEGLDKKYECKSLNIWRKLAQKSNVVFDIGANTGLYSLLAQVVSPESDIYGFEPVGKIYDKFVANCQINQYKIKCEQLALSNQTGEVIFYDLPVLNNYSASLNKDFSDIHHAQLIDQRIELKVKAMTLKDYIESNKIDRIDLMKIDVETFEPQVLEGMDIYLEKFRPAMLIEILKDEIGERVEAIVNGLGYLYFLIDESKGIKQQNHIIAQNKSNYLLCSHEQAQYLSLI